MSLRLIVTLLIALLSLPAMSGSAHLVAMGAAAHAQPSHHHSMGGSMPEPQDQHHADAACMGCIAPATLGEAEVLPPVSGPSAETTVLALTGAPFGPARPTTPPPRQG